LESLQHDEVRFSLISRSSIPDYNEVTYMKLTKHYEQAYREMLETPAYPIRTLELPSSDNSQLIVSPESKSISDPGQLKDELSLHRSDYDKRVRVREIVPLSQQPQMLREKKCQFDVINGHRKFENLDKNPEIGKKMLYASKVGKVLVRQNSFYNEFGL